LSIKSIYIVRNPWGSYACIVNDRSWGAGIRALHAAGRPDPTAGARAVPVCQTTSFIFEDSPDAADLFTLRKYRNICSPAVAAFEERMVSLRDGIGAVATSSRHAAELLTCTADAVRGFVFGVAARNLSQVV